MLESIISPHEWERLVSICTTLEAYVAILKSFESQKPITKSRLAVLAYYTDCITKTKPHLRDSINFVFDLFLQKYQTKSECFIL